MAHTLTIDLDDRTYAELEAMARDRGETPESIALAALHGLQDPLDRHIGAYPTGHSGWADQVHDTIGSSTISPESSTPCKA